MPGAASGARAPADDGGRGFADVHFAPKGVTDM
jgi:hypothetical protein